MGYWEKLPEHTDKLYQWLQTELLERFWKTWPWQQKQRREPSPAKAIVLCCNPSSQSPISPSHCYPMSVLPKQSTELFTDPEEDRWRTLRKTKTHQRKRKKTRFLACVDGSNGRVLTLMTKEFEKVLTCVLRFFFFFLLCSSQKVKVACGNGINKAKLWAVEGFGFFFPCVKQCS